MLVEFCDFPLAYLIAFTTYGTRLPGDERGWVSRLESRYGTPHSPPRPGLKRTMKTLLAESPYELGPFHRPLVLAAIRAGLYISRLAA